MMMSDFCIRPTGTPLAFKAIRHLMTVRILFVLFLFSILLVYLHHSLHCMRLCCVEISFYYSCLFVPTSSSIGKSIKWRHLYIEISLFFSLVPCQSTLSFSGYMTPSFFHESSACIAERLSSIFPSYLLLNAP